ncbi:MAG: dienelactone hydrolase family protein [Pseudomonadales bacterium]|nr:dienelactone hydrolase family protein [Pseudomonadales bacterium]
MGRKVRVSSADGFSLGAYCAAPAGEPAGAVVVIQEIFGVNGHIRDVVDGYARSGYFAIAPQLFDRLERDVELGYEGADMQRGIQLALQQLDRRLALQDLQATVAFAAGESGGRAVGVVGYCFGGLMSWLCACELDSVSGAVCYYGGGIAGVAELKPRCPVLMHFGERDAHIPMSDVEKIRAAHPEVSVQVYAADHGFNCDHRASYDKESADLALERTLNFFRQHLQDN